MSVVSDYWKPQLEKADATISRLSGIISALKPMAYLEVTNLGSESDTGRPPKYFECRLCGDWNDELKHIEHADNCPLHGGGARGHQQQLDTGQKP